MLRSNLVSEHYYNASKIGPSKGQWTVAINALTIACIFLSKSQYLVYRSQLLQFLIKMMNSNYDPIEHFVSLFFL